MLSDIEKYVYAVVITQEFVSEDVVPAPVGNFKLVNNMPVE